MSLFMKTIPFFTHNDKQQELNKKTKQRDGATIMMLNLTNRANVITPASQLLRSSSLFSGLPKVQKLC